MGSISPRPPPPALSPGTQGAQGQRGAVQGLIAFVTSSSRRPCLTQGDFSFPTHAITRVYTAAYMLHQFRVTRPRIRSSVFLPGSQSCLILVADPVPYRAPLPPPWSIRAYRLMTSTNPSLCLPSLPYPFTVTVTLTSFLRHHWPRPPVPAPPCLTAGSQKGTQ